MKYLLKFGFLLFFLLFIPTKSQQRQYLNCDQWDESINKENLTDIIWPNIFQNITDTDQVIVNYGNCSIKMISELPEYPQIIYLSLEHNKILKLQRETFYNIPNLEVLKLNNNNLTRLANGVFANLAKVEYLYLQENQIINIQSKVFIEMVSLTYLRLEKNKITALGTNIFSSNIKLEYLNMDDTIMDINKLIRKLPNLNRKSRFPLPEDISLYMKLPASNIVTNFNISVNKVRMDPMINNDVLIYGVASCVLLLMTIISVIITIKLGKRDKNADLLKYDTVKNPSLTSEESVSYYIEALCSSDKTFNAKYGARKLSYLEPKVFKKNAVSPFQRNQSYLSIY